MAGTIVSDTIQNGAGTSTSTSNVIAGCAKAWCNYNALTATIRSSFNVSSITVIGTGQYVFNFTTAMPNANYSANVMQGWNNYNNGGQSQINDSASTSSAVAVGLLNYNSSLYVAPTTVSIQVFSS